jgi:hypothetical protein
LKRSAVAVFLAALLAVASPADAASTVLTDPAGDAIPCYTFSTCSSLTPYLRSEPSIDFRQVEIGTTAVGDLFVEIQVTDLADWQTIDDKMQFWFSALTNNGQTQVWFSAVRVDDATVGYLRVAPGGYAFGELLTPVTFDPNANTIRWEASLARLNEVQDTVCATCSDIVVGDTLVDPYLTAHFTEVNNYTGATPVNTVTYEDLAFAQTTYNLGD